MPSVSPALRMRCNRKGQLLRRPLQNGQLVGQELIAIVDCEPVTGRTNQQSQIMGSVVEEWETIFIDPGPQFDIDEATYFWLSDRLYKIQRSLPDTDSDGALVRLILQERKVVKQSGT